MQNTKHTVKKNPHNFDLLQGKGRLFWNNEFNVTVKLTKGNLVTA